MWNLLIPMIGQVLDKILPDPKASEEAKLKLATMAQQGQLAELQAFVDLAKGQMAVNQVEAASSSSYTASWRPTVGYVLAAALAFQYVVNPLIIWGAALLGSGVTPPSIGLDDHLWELIMGMLGLAGWRTLDKVKGRG